MSKKSVAPKARKPKIPPGSVDINDRAAVAQAIADAKRIEAEQAVARRPLTLADINIEWEHGGRTYGIDGGELALILQMAIDRWETPATDFMANLLGAEDISLQMHVVQALLSEAIGKGCTFDADALEALYRLFSDVKVRCDAARRGAERDGDGRWKVARRYKVETLDYARRALAEEPRRSA